MAEPVLDAEAIEEQPAPEGPGDAEVRALPAERASGALDSWRGEVGAIAVVAAGSIAAGVATVVAVNAARARSGRGARTVRRRREREGIVASRSFLVDVHVLGR